MIRSQTGISNIPVSEEIDPGFGPDTEQRRVEFAAKLEEEAFSIALGDATRLAKANLIAALKLWEHEDLIPKVKPLTLQDIMIIWVIFELVVLDDIWSNAVDDKKVLTKNQQILKQFIDAIVKPVYKDIPKKINGILIQKEKISKIRENYGGDLIFSLRSKNEIELLKIYEHSYPKLPKSLRDKFSAILSGINITYKRLLSLLKNDEDVFQDVAQELKKQEEFEDKNRDIVFEICEIFAKETIDSLKKNLATTKTPKEKEVEEKVRGYYGIK